MIRMLRRFLSTPGMIGSITPSSSTLAKAMTRQIAKGVAVFELGAGTGVITRQIQKMGLAGSLVVFEQDPQLAEYLRCQINPAKVLEGLFHDTVDSLDSIPEHLDIVSSLPFKSLSGRLYAKTVASICAILRGSPNRRLIQYTYFDGPPFVSPDRGLRWRRLVRIWANVPPATIWELRAEVVDTLPRATVPPTK